MADIDIPQASLSIQVALAVAVIDVNACAALDHQGGMSRQVRRVGKGVQHVAKILLIGTGARVFCNIDLDSKRNENRPDGRGRGMPPQCMCQRSVPGRLCRRAGGWPRLSGLANAQVSPWASTPPAWRWPAANVEPGTERRWFIGEPLGNVIGRKAVPGPSARFPGRWTERGSRRRVRR